MATTLQKITGHVNDNPHIYRDKRNMVTLVLWGLALASHAILIPRLVSELYHEFKQRK
jgi:hypothetical protein